MARPIEEKSRIIGDFVQRRYNCPKCGHRLSSNAYLICSPCQIEYYAEKVELHEETARFYKKKLNALLVSDPKKIIKIGGDR